MVRATGRLPEELTAGRGGAGYSALTAAGAGLQYVDAVNSGLSELLSASVSAGASSSRTDYRGATSTAQPSGVYAGRDVQAEAGRDIIIEGGRVVAERDVSLDAGRDLTISAALNTGSSSTTSSSVGADVGLKGSIGASGVGGGVNMSAYASGSTSSGRSDTRVDAVIAAGDTLSSSSGRDTTVAGAHLEGDSVWMDVGRDLTVASLQDHTENESSSWSAGGSVTVGAGVSSSVGVSGGSSHMSSGWVNTQTSILGQKKTILHVGDTTRLEGGLIASATGNLLIDTGSLMFTDIQGSKKGESIIWGLSGSYDSKANESITSWGVNRLPVAELGYASFDRYQKTRATVGEGQIVVRDGSDTEALNRDVSRAQEEIWGDNIKMNLFISPYTIQDIVEEGLDGDLGRAWAFPNTIVGLIGGTLGTGVNILFGEKTEIIYDWNAINFTNTPFYKLAKIFNNNIIPGAITFGNIELYSEGIYPNNYSSVYIPSDPQLALRLSGITHLEFSTHEEKHTYQYQHYGPFYGLFYVLGGFASGDNPFELEADQYSLSNMHRWGKEYQTWFSVPHFNW